MTDGGKAIAEVPGLRLRPAEEGDLETVLNFIRDLAAYEKLSREVSADVETLRRSLFGKRPAAEVLLAEISGQAVGFAVYFHNFSTFTGRAGLYLEDIFVRPDRRGEGVGLALFRHLARLALDRGCSRLELSALDWNEPAIRFYKGLGAAAMDEWTVYRFTPEELKKIV